MFLWDRLYLIQALLVGMQIFESLKICLIGFKLVKIIIISNNNALEGFSEEHSFSLLIEVDGKNILFDTGNTFAFKENIKKLNIDFKEIDSLVLSHGHYDHCGNISEVVKYNKNIKIFHHPHLANVRYSIHPDRNPMVRNIGLSSINRKIITDNPSFSSNKVTNISKRTFITGEIPRLSEEDTGGPFYYDPNGKTIDTIPDDQAIWIETDKGLIIITGCCHSGIINTVEYIKQQSGIDTVLSIIGGFHLSKASENRVETTISYLNSLNMKLISPGHCTGDNIITRFRDDLNCIVDDFKAGKEIYFNEDN